MRFEGRVHGSRQEPVPPRAQPYLVSNIFFKLSKPP
jgi:hypothetical protein